MKDWFKKNKTVIIVVSISIICLIIILSGIIITLTSSYNDKYEIVTDISKYNEVIDVNDEYLNGIFPSNISSLDVKDFKSIYYNPWDPNYFVYLVIDYNDTDLIKEKDRLESIGTNEYIGYYGVTGFSNYTLLAMHADSYNGFVYAINKDNRIIYVKIYFCNYFTDIDYQNNFPIDYLPDNFDATLDNNYEKEMTKDINLWG